MADLSSYINIKANAVATTGANSIISTTGNVTANYFIGNGSQLTDLASGTTIANGTSNVTIPTADGDVNINIGEAVYTFDAVGNLSLVNGFVLGAPGGDASISTNNSLYVYAQNGVDISTTGGSYHWNFDANGNLTLPNGPILSNIGINQAENQDLVINIYDGDGNGWALYNSVSDGVHTLSQTKLNQNEFTITTDYTGASHTWSFDNSANLILPQGGYIGAAGVKGDGTMLTGGTGNIASLTSFYADAPGIYAGCFTANPDGTLNITTYGNGTGQLGQWTFSEANLTIPGNITAPNNDQIIVQALDNAGNVNSQLRLDPNNTLTRLTQWSNQQSTSFTTTNWATGEYTEQGGQGAVVFTNAPDIIAFVNSLAGVGQIYFSVNGGPQLDWDGTSAGLTDITFFTPTLPAVDPTTVTTFEYFYSYNSLIEMDYDSEEFNIEANNVDLTLRTSNQRRIELNSDENLSINGNGSVSISNQSNILGVEIRTDSTSLSAPAWLYGVDGSLTLPGEGVIQSIDDSVTLRTLNTVSGNANSVYLGTAGGLGFNDQEIGGNWLEIFRNGAEPEIRVPVGRGNLNIQTASGNTAYNWVLDDTGNLTLAGSLISNNASPAPIIQNFDFIAGSGNITSLGNEFNITTGLQGNGQGKNLTLAASNGLSNARAGDVTIAGGFGSNGAANGNVTIKSAELSWTFDNTGNLTIPGTSGGLIKTVANGAIGITAINNGTDNPAQLMSWRVGQSNPDTILSTYANSATVMSNVNGTINTWSFDNAGNLTLPGNTFAVNYANGTAVSLGGSSYGNANVATFLAAYGSNTVSTTGNIASGNLRTSGSISATGNITTAGNFIGNGAALTNVTVSVAGNIIGTQSNVSLVAGSYTATFDNTGVLTLPTVGGAEGGEINFGAPTANTTLIGPVKLDVYQDRIRFFDGSTKGAYIDLSQAAAGVGSLLNNRVSGLVNAGTFVTMDLIKATVTGSGNRGLSLATTTGTFTYNIGGNFGQSGSGSGGQSLAAQTLTTTATTSIFGWSFGGTGDISTYILTDTTNSRCYRITLMIGASYNNNMISIERLV